MEKDFKKQLKLFSNIFGEAQEQGKKEADVVMYVVQFFKDAMGYDVFTEISKEYQIKEKYCDIAIKLQGQVELLIEVKQAGLRLADRHIEQAENYAMKSGTKWVLLTNGVEWKLFHLSYSETEGIERVVVFRIDLLRDFNEKPEEVAEKFGLLQKKNYQKGALDNYWKKKTMLEPGALAKALFTQPVFRAINREVNRGAKAKVGFDDIVKALKNLLDKEILADLADIKIRKRRRSKRRISKMPKESKPQKLQPKESKEKIGGSEEEHHES